MNIKPILKATGAALKRNAPSILIFTGIGGGITAAVMACKATPRATRAIAHIQAENPTFWEKTKAVAPIYAPAIGVGVASAAAILLANKLHIKRQAVVLAAYELTEKALTEWQSKTAENVDETVLETIKQSIATDDIHRNPPDLPAPPPEMDGKVYPCRDSVTGVTFYSTVANIDNARNRLNSILLEDGEACINDLYECLDISDYCEVGNALKWVYERHTDLVDIAKRWVNTPSGEPCCVLEYIPAPEYDFRYR